MRKALMHKLVASQFSIHGELATATFDNGSTQEITILRKAQTEQLSAFGSSYNSDDAEMLLVRKSDIADANSLDSVTFDGVTYGIKDPQSAWQGTCWQFALIP